VVLGGRVLSPPDLGTKRDPERSRVLHGPTAQHQNAATVRQSTPHPPQLTTGSFVLGIGQGQSEHTLFVKTHAPSQQL
jgi:hypothetical protein